MIKAKRIIIIFLIAILLIPCTALLQINKVSALTLSAPKKFEGYVYQNYVQLRWENPNDSFSHTIIERSIDQDNFYPITTLHKTMTEYKDYNISNGHIYTYRARTYFSNNYSDYTSQVEAILLYPTDFTITQAYSDHVDLEWSMPIFPSTKMPDYKTIIERRQMNYNTWEKIATLPINENTYRDLDIASDTAYYYRIRTQFAEDRFSSYIPHMGGINTRTLFPLTTNLWAYALSNNTIKLEWDTSSLGENKVFIERLDSDFGYVTIYSGTSDNYVDRMLQTGRTYTYRLYMLSKSGYRSEYTDSVSLKPEALPMPVNLSAKALASDCIALSWEYPYEDETGFEIWRKASSEWELIATPPKNTDSFSDKSSESGKSYTYKVRAVRGDSAFSAFTKEESVINLYPESPGELVYIINKGYLSLYSKSYVPANNTYTLEYRKNINSQWEELKSATKGTLVARIDVSEYSEYYFRMRANLGGLETIGPELHFFGSAPEAPRNLQAQHVGYKRLTLTWEDITEKEDGYNIYRSVRTGETTKRALIGSVGKDIENYIDSSPIEGGQVYYEVVAYNISGESKAAGLSIRIPTKALYKDIAPYQWAHESIYTLQGLGAFENASDGYFHPQNVITRGQLARMIIKSFNISYDNLGLLPPADISPSNIYYKDIMTALRAGLLHTDVNSNIYPNKTVTRQEIILMLNGALGNAGLSLISHNTNVLETFNDYSQIAPEDLNIMASFAGERIITGKSGQMLSLQTYATKAEAVVFIYRTLTGYKLLK